ncbi:MAG: hypothetical protein QOE06_1414 [Thermoleophilaceae bacterium]|jgi:hypothetical protein|nr:hypothetical protein [Thermoleophilaceae bacterium]
MRIDIVLRQLWGLTPEDGMHVVVDLAQLPEGHVIRDLFLATCSRPVSPSRFSTRRGRSLRTPSS